MRNDICVMNLAQSIMHRLILVINLCEVLCAIDIMRNEYARSIMRRLILVINLCEVLCAMIYA